MYICVAGDVHGRIDEFYKNINKFESLVNVKFDAVLQAGDFGIWINGDYHDGITKLYGRTGDFPVWFKEKRNIPVKTYFINGNNEDFNFLRSVRLSGDFELLKNLHYMPNGSINFVAGLSGKESITVAGIGGRYSPEHFKHKEYDRYYTENEINNMITGNNSLPPADKVDIFISHDAPEGVVIEDNDNNRYYPKAIGLREAILKTRPKIAFFGHHHGTCNSNIEGIPVYGLNIIGEKNNMTALKTDKDRIEIIGTY